MAPTSDFEKKFKDKWIQIIPTRPTRPAGKLATHRWLSEWDKILGTTHKIVALDIHYELVAIDVMKDFGHKDFYPLWLDNSWVRIVDGPRHVYRSEKLEEHNKQLEIVLSQRDRYLHMWMAAHGFSVKPVPGVVSPPAKQKKNTRLPKEGEEVFFVKDAVEIFTKKINSSNRSQRLKEDTISTKTLLINQYKDSNEYKLTVAFTGKSTWFPGEIYIDLNVYSLKTHSWIASITAIYPEILEVDDLPF